MAGKDDVALEQQQAQGFQQERQQIANTPKPAGFDPNFGKPTSAWARLAAVGAAKTQKQNLIISAFQKGGAKGVSDLVKAGKAVGNFAKNTAVSTGKAAVGAGMDIANTTGNIEAKGAQKIAKTVGYKGNIGLGLGGGKTVSSNQTNQQKFGKTLTKVGGENTAEAAAGNIAQTAALGIPGSGKVGTITGEFLLDQLGKLGVKDLAEKAGIDVTKGTINDVAEQVAKSKAGQQAGKVIIKGGTSVTQRALKAGSEGALMGGLSGGGQAASNNQSGKQILKSAGKGAVVGGALGVGSSLFHSAYRAATGKAASDSQILAKAAQHRANESMANERGLPTGETTKALPQGKLTKGLSEGKVTKQIPESTKSEAPTVKGGESNTVKSGDLNKQAQIKLQHAQSVHELKQSYDKEISDTRDADHVKTEKPVDGYNDTKALTKDLADTFKSVDDSARGGNIQKTKEGYIRTIEHSPFYRSVYAEKGHAPSNADYKDEALSRLKSGNAPYGMSKTYLNLKAQAENEIDQKYVKKLDDLTTTNKAALSEAKTPTDKGFAIPTKEQTSGHAAALTRIAKIDKEIADAQKNGTTKSAEEMRGILRERQGLLDKLSGKEPASEAKPSVKEIIPEAKKPTAMEKLTQAAKKSEPVKPVESKEKPQMVSLKAAAEKSKARVGLGETGAVKSPVAAGKDVQDMIAKHQASAHYNNDLQRSADMVEGQKDIIKNDSKNIIKGRVQLTNAEKKELQDYRDAKAAGLTPKSLSSAKLVKEDADVTELNKASQKADAARARLEGKEAQARAIESRDPSTYTHRIAQGKGSAYDYVAQGDRQSVMNRGFAKSKAGDKSRTMYNLTDENGNRHTVSIKNTPIKDAEGRTVKRLNKQVTEYTNGGKTARSLGSLNLKTNEERMQKELAPIERNIDNLTKEQKILSATKSRSEAASGRLTNIETKLQQAHEDYATVLNKYDTSELNGKSFQSNGHTYTFGQATVDEIQRNSGQKYYVDPKLNAVANYIDSKTALENAKFIDNIKTSPESENFISKPGETAPAGYKSIPELPQFQGYKFEPKTAEVLRDIVGAKANEKSIINAVGRFLRQTIVYFPVKHDLNMIAGYQVDRGLSKLASPAAYVRMVSSIYHAIDDVRTQSDFYQQLQKKGFSLMSSDDSELNKAFKSEIQGLIDNKNVLSKVATQVDSTPERLSNVYSKIQHVMVWNVQDVLNIARVRERMMDTTFTKGDDLGTAIDKVDKTNLTYRVPSRVAGSRSLANTLKSDKVFFGTYRYDLYKTMTNILKSSVNVTDPKGAIEAWDKLAMTAVGVAVLWPVVDKGIASVTGDPNTHMSAPGVLGLAQDFQELMSSKETPEAFTGQQIYISPVVTGSIQLLNNQNQYGEPIVNPYASKATQATQVVSYLKSQLSPAQKLTSMNNAKGNKIASWVLSLSGASIPKDSSDLNKYYSLAYDQATPMYDMFKGQVQAGKTNQAIQTANQYNLQLTSSLQSAWESANPGKTISSQKVANYIQNLYDSPWIKTDARHITDASKPTVSILNKVTQPVKKY